MHLNLVKTRKPSVTRAALIALTAGLSLGASVAHAQIVDSGPVSIAIPDNFDGIYLNVATGQTGLSAMPGWDLNPFSADLGEFNLWSVDTNSWFNPQGVQSGNYNLPLGTVVQGANTAFFRPGGFVNLAPNINLNSNNNHLGFRFTNEAGGTNHFGYMQVQFGATAGTRSIVRYWYNATPNAAITVGGATPPQFGYTPTQTSTVAATGGTTIGSTGNLSIAVSVATPGVGTGALATTTTTCTAPTAPFAGFGQTVTAVGTGAITGGPLAGTCTLGAAVATQTLTCSENSGGNLFTRTWTLSCPAGTPVAPTIAYNPGEGTPVLFTGVTTIGSTGNGSIAATPSGGSGSGAAGTTTINNCTFGGANSGSFAGAAAINLSFVGSTTTPQNLALTCTSGATALAATLTCEERRGVAAPVPRNWQLSCPAGAVPNTPPVLGYTPTPNSTVNFSGVTTIGSTGNGTIVATPSGGSGSGPGATTTFDYCELGGANPTAFAGAAAVMLSFVGNTTTPQNINLTCTSAASVQTATLTCAETRGLPVSAVAGGGAGISPVTTRQWQLSCPAGTVLNTPPTIAYNPTTGTDVAFTGVTTIGTTGNGTVVATPSGGSGSGAAATTTINTCTLGGANPGSFAGAAAINLSFVGNTTTPQNLTLTCTSAASVQTATLTCLETRGVVAPPQVSGIAPNPAQRQWNLSCPAGAAVAPTIAYNPNAGSPVDFTGVSTIGSTGNGTVVATPSGGSGSGAAATTTINTCTLGGANPGSFAGAAAINLSFVGNTTTPQNLALTCTSQQTAQTATLTCNETRGAAAPVQRQWPLNCPAGTPVAPTIAYNPTTGSNVAFTGVTTIGTTGNGTIAATPSGGIGTGAAATTTINTCTLGGANPGSFAGAAAINLSFVGNTTTPQNMALTCTSAATAQAATLTCNETRGAAAPVQRQWPLNCPAGTLLPLTSAPVSGSTVNLSGVSGGNTGTSTVTVTNPNPIAVALTCTAPAFPFTASPLAFSIPASGNTPVTVGISPAAPGNYTGSLTCNVTGSSQVLTFSLTGSLAAPIAVNATSVWSLMLLMLGLFGFAAVAVRRQG